MRRQIGIAALATISLTALSGCSSDHGPAKTGSWNLPDAAEYPGANAASWVYSHEAYQKSNVTPNNHNKGSSGCPYKSYDEKYCAGLATMTLTLSNDAGQPKRRFPQLSAEEVRKRVGVVSGPESHWDFVSVDFDPALLNVTVKVKGYTYPQQFQVALPVEEWHP